MLAAVLLLGNSLGTFAATISQVQKEKNATQNKLNEINQSITAIESKKKQLRSELSHLNEDLVETMLGLEMLEADLESKQEEIDTVQAEYDFYRELEESQYEAMKLRIQYM
jgi:chromosome segregation ATPase